MAKYKVAVATSDGKTVDTHFGHALSFTIFVVDEETGAFEDTEERTIEKAGCSGGECGGAAQSDGSAVTDAGCGGRNGAAAESGVMDAIAAQLEDVDYVLVARIGPHAIRALSKHGITAYDIVLPIDEAIEKINGFRKKINARKHVALGGKD
ncbi:MAG: hypothetical protein IJS09_07610 [Treponema sp.]|nr:hypothetical protein [Treponema sp.]